MAEDANGRPLPDYGNLSSPETQVFILHTAHNMHIVFVDSEALVNMPMIAEGYPDVGHLIQAARYIFSADPHSVSNLVAMLNSGVHNDLDKGMEWHYGQVEDPPPYENGTRMRIFNAYQGIEPEAGTPPPPPVGKMWQQLDDVLRGFDDTHRDQ